MENVLQDCPSAPTPTCLSIAGTCRLSVIGHSNPYGELRTTQRVFGYQPPIVPARLLSIRSPERKRRSFFDRKVINGDPPVIVHRHSELLQLTAICRSAGRHEVVDWSTIVVNVYPSPTQSAYGRIQGLKLRIRGLDWVCARKDPSTVLNAIQADSISCGLTVFFGRDKPIYRCILQATTIPNPFGDVKLLKVHCVPLWPDGKSHRRSAPAEAIPSPRRNEAVEWAMERLSFVHFKIY